MLHAIVLICSMAVTDCSEKNARDVILPPGEYPAPVACLMRGYAYIADTAVAGRLDFDEYAVVRCRQSQRED